MNVVLMIDWFLYYAVELADALSKEHRVLLLTRDHSYEISPTDRPEELDDFLDRCLDKSVEKEKLKFRQSNPKSLWEILRLRRKIRMFGPDVIHIQETTDWRILLLAGVFGFRRIVLTVHDVVTHAGDSRSIMTFLGRWMRKKAGAVIVHGESMKNELAGRGVDKNRIHVIPHGAFFLYKKWDDGTVREEGHTILFFGRISEYKGMDVFLESVPLILKDIPDLKVIIAGRGDFLRPYAGLIGDGRHFEIHNRFIATSEVAGFFRRASLVVLPYKEASQSGVVPIAFAFGKPVVVTDVGSIPEVVEDGQTGFVVPPNSPEHLAKAIVGILRDPQKRKSMAKRALEKARTDLSWDRIAEKTAQIYRSVVAGDES